MMTMSVVGCVLQCYDAHDDLAKVGGWNCIVVSTDVTSRKDYHNMDCLDNSDVVILDVAEKMLLLMY